MHRNLVKQVLYFVLRIGIIAVLAYLFYFLLQLTLTGDLVKNVGDLWGHFLDLKNPVFWVNYGITLSIIIFLIALIGDFYFGLAVSSSLFLIISFININKVVSRSEPLLPSDFSMVSQANSLIRMVKWQAILALIILMVVLFGLAFCLRRWTAAYWWQNHLWVWPLRLLVVLALGGNFWLLTQAGNEHSWVAKKLAAYEMVNTDHEQMANYQNRGFWVGFAFNVESTPMTKPDNYSPATVRKIVHRYQRRLATENKDKSFDKVNIIYILNESLSNPQRTKDRYPIVNNQNPMPFISQILDHPTENQASGYMVSPFFGGGTANIEFEANTGFSNYFLQSTPYQDIVSRRDYFPSVMNYLQVEGYQAQAYHPFSGTMYRRRQAYPALGIEKFQDQKQLKGLKQSPDSYYTSDFSTYPNIYAQQNRARQFSLVITMLKHMPYSAAVGEKSQFKLQHLIDNDADKTKRMQAYFQEVNSTDQAFKQLVEHYQNSKRKTIIAMYGDHYPGDGIYDTLLQQDPLKSHTTPFVMAANFKLDQQNYDYFSPNYMSLMLLKQLNYPLSPFYNLLQQVQEEVPVLTQPVQIDSDGKQTNGSDGEKGSWTTSQAYKDYQLIEYDLTYGQAYAQKYGMFKAPKD
ncbi:sulfatase-like hydrolase/transferase [Lactobacillus sp. DCY120]|uniref:Sulfatase-like hydrolase/transferase n=1 Tax=Bombilactobacillus apium TaxID=2675299 RepID=A0A850R5X5_9LACO|nr:alkaline phosphatase family protein [Bombilactobacillus apium]NVY95945.1 sulfatase-like hydrolase/transferase [Bombilactobacillus apium]